MILDKQEFSQVLQRAVAGSHPDLERVLQLYDPLIRKYSHIDDSFNEDLHQYLLIHIALNIHKFTI